MMEKACHSARTRLLARAAVAAALPRLWRCSAPSIRPAFRPFDGAVHALGIGMANLAAERITPRVAIAEDDSDSRDLLVVALRTAGYDVAEMHDGDELLCLLQSTPPGFFQVVIADQRMPRLFGLECLERAGARAPFVIVSASDDPTFYEAASRFGAAAVVRKPIELPALLAIVAQVLSAEDERKHPSSPPRAA
jgi:CheY-like chemotaxis protein